MLDIACTINSVDYAATLHNLYPRILEKSAEAREKHILFRLISELGDDGERVLDRLVGIVDEEEQRILLCRCMASFAPELTEILNRKLQEIDLGKCFTAGLLMPELDGESIVLTVRNADVDYAAFKKQIGRRAPGGILGQLLRRIVDSIIGGGDAEQKMVKAAENKLMQTMLLEMLSTALHKQGICMELDGLSIQPSENDMPLADAAVTLLDKHTEDILIKALVEYIRMAEQPGKSEMIRHSA